MEVGILIGVGAIVLYILITLYLMYIEEKMYGD